MLLLDVSPNEAVEHHHDRLPDESLWVYLDLLGLNHRMLGLSAVLIFVLVTEIDLVKAVEHQGPRIDEVHASIAATRTAGNGSAPAGTKAAGAMKLLLGILKQAGAAGVGRRDLATAMHEAGVKAGTTEVAQAVLHGAGLVRSERGRWFIDGA